MSLLGRIGAFVFLAANLIGCVGPGQSPDAGEVTVVLVRHAEKQSGVPDPGLTPRGESRAQALTRVLKDVEITHIWSTDYRRTRDTALPVLRDRGMDLAIYDPRQLGVFADQLAGTPGIHLVVGHSNTTPELVSLLGGDPGSAIRDADEYDRMYWVFTHREGGARSLLLRYDSQPGEAAEPENH